MARVEDRRDRPVDAVGELWGPFRRPVRQDWAFRLFGLAVAIDLVARAAAAWSSSDGSALTVAVGLLVMLPFDALAILVLFSIVIGVPRGFLLGYRGGARRPGRTDIEP